MVRDWNNLHNLMIASSHLVFSFLDLRGSYLNDELCAFKHFLSFEQCCMLEWGVYELEPLNGQLFCYLESSCADSFCVVVT
jgi:hypothetical protein